MRCAPVNSSLGHAYAGGRAFFVWSGRRPGGPDSCGCRRRAGTELITSSEAALPTDQVTGRERGITRAPNVVIVSPSPAAGTLKSPLSLKIRFESHGGAEIDVDSVLLTYLKKPAVDLTQRIKPFIDASGIDVEDAEVPPGSTRFV